MTKNFFVVQQTQSSTAPGHNTHRSLWSDENTNYREKGHKVLSQIQSKCVTIPQILDRNNDTQYV